MHAHGGTALQELDTLELLVTAERPEPRTITAEDISRLQILDAVCHESLRLLPTAPSGGFRKLQQDTVVRDHASVQRAGVCLPRPPPPGNGVRPMLLE
jgi:cytochrome P450